MREVIVVVFACLTLVACGGTTEKTVVVNPTPGSTTVVDSDGHTHVVTPGN
jgi:hypothetical protein